MSYLARHIAKIMAADRLAQGALASEAVKTADARRVSAATWVTWPGRAECPVHPRAVVSIVQRDGRVHTGRAGEWAWNYPQGPDDWEPDDIVAYRVRGPSHVLSQPSPSNIVNTGEGAS